MKRALILVTDQGFDWNEMALALDAFADAGWAPELCSPGGHPQANRASYDIARSPGRLTRLFRRNSASGRQDRHLIEAVMRTKRLAGLNPLDYAGYDAVYVVGGVSDKLPHDLAASSAVAGLVSETIRSGKWLAGRLHLFADYGVLDPAVKNTKRPGRVRRLNHLIFARNPDSAGKVATALVEAQRREELGQASEAGRARAELPEFLDRKSGRR